MKAHLSRSFSIINIWNFKSFRCTKLKKMAKPHFWLFGSSKKAFLWFSSNPAWTNGQIMQTIYFYQHMHYQVNLMHQTQENGQKSKFWLFGSFKKSFLWFLNDPAWVIWWKTHEHHLVLLKYPISCQSDAPNLRNWPKTSFLAIWIIQKGYFCGFWMIQHGL